MKVEETAFPYAAHKTKLSYQDYQNLPEDGNRYELINGELIMVAAPLTIHQIVSANIFFELQTYAKKTKSGIVLTSPIDVVLSEHNILQPDIIFITNERKSIITEKNIQGAPDLVIEILSPSSFYYDWFDKKELYEQHGVMEYWIVDPLRYWVETYQRKKNKFEKFQRRDKTGNLISSVLSDFSITLEKMFSA